MTTLSLEQYQDYTFPKYLDGRYFYKVLSYVDYLSVAPVPLVIQINHTTQEFSVFNFELIRNYYQRTNETNYIRLVIEIFDTKGNLVSRHSNLLILNPLNTILIRVEPQPWNHHRDLNDDLDDFLYEIFDDIEEVESTYLDIQLASDDAMCNAYVLHYAYFSMKNLPIEYSGDIEKFARTVEEIYGPLSPTELGGPDKEFGDAVTTNTIAGGAIGAGVGLAVGGPVGLLVGGGAGALIGRGVSKKR